MICTRTPQSLQTPYVNKSTGSHRSQPPMAQRMLSTDAALGLPRPTRCLTPALAPARLMSATSSQVYSARHPSPNSIATWLPRLQRHATLCSGWRRMPTAIEILHVSRSSIRLFRPPPRCQSNDFRLRVGLLASGTHDLIQIVLTRSFFFIRTCSLRL